METPLYKRLLAGALFGFLPQQTRSATHTRGGKKILWNLCVLKINTDRNKGSFQKLFPTVRASHDSLVVHGERKKKIGVTLEV